MDVRSRAARSPARQDGEADSHRGRAGCHSLGGDSGGRRRSIAADDRRRSVAMTRSGVLATAVWAAFVLVAILVVVSAQYTTDLSAFLPRSPTPAQRLLVE